MQDLGDDPRVGRRRLSAVQSERGTPTVTTPDESVVSAQRLLKVAAALSDGCVRIPMMAGIDSLNVAAAAAVAFWVLGRRDG